MDMCEYQMRLTLFHRCILFRIHAHMSEIEDMNPVNDLGHWTDEIYLNVNPDMSVWVYAVSEFNYSPCYSV